MNQHEPNYPEHDSDDELRDEHLPAVPAVVRSAGTSMLSVDDVLTRLDSLQDLMKRAMVMGIDYGTIPGTKSKPTLLKPGAEKLAVMFRLAPRFKTAKTFHDDGHLTVESSCEIYGQDGNFLGESSTICSTREAKFAYRKAERTCPQCGKPAIIKGKAEYGGGWLCWAKKDGCNAKFLDNDPAIVSQATERVANEDLADSYNTVIRMAEKRCFLAAIRLVTGSSALFDEEIPGSEPDHGHDDTPPKQSRGRRPAEEKPNTHSRIHPDWFKNLKQQKTVAELTAYGEAFSKAFDWTREEIDQFGVEFDERMREISSNSP